MDSTEETEQTRSVFLTIRVFKLQVDSKSDYRIQLVFGGKPILRKPKRTLKHTWETTHIEDLSIEFHESWLLFHNKRVASVTLPGHVLNRGNFIEWCPLSEGIGKALVGVISDDEPKDSFTSFDDIAKLHELELERLWVRYKIQQTQGKLQELKEQKGTLQGMIVQTQEFVQPTLSLTDIRSERAHIQHSIAEALLEQQQLREKIVRLHILKKACSD